MRQRDVAGPSGCGRRALSPGDSGRLENADVVRHVESEFQGRPGLARLVGGFADVSFTSHVYGLAPEGSSHRGGAFYPDYLRPPASSSDVGEGAGGDVL